MTLIVTALKEEFPFESEFNILYTGVGKINASVSLLNYLHLNPQVNRIINVGTAAGTANPKHCVLQCGNFIEGDINYPNYVLEPIMFDNQLKTLATFDSFQTKLPDRQCDCVDMEGYAIAKICKIKKINFFCFKYISDIIGEQDQESTWLDNYKNGRFLLKEFVTKIYE